MKNRTLTLILCLITYAFAGSSLFAQSQGPANVWTSGADKGEFSNPLIVPANSGTTSTTFAIGNDSRIVAAQTVTGLYNDGATLAETESSVSSTFAWPASDTGGTYGQIAVVIGDPTGSPFDSAGVQAWDEDLDGWATKAVPSGDVLGTTGTQTISGDKTFTGATTIESLTITEQAIASSATPTWDVNAGQNATFTATSAATFTISNLAAGQTGTLSVTQTSGTAGYVMTFPAGTKQAFGGTNTYTMSGTNTIDILYFRRTGTNTVIEGVVPGITP